MSRKDNVHDCKTARDFDGYITQHGGEFDRQCGSHAVYHTPGGAQIVVPQHKGDIPIGTRFSIIKTIIKLGLTVMIFTYAWPLIQDLYTYVTVVLPSIPHY